MRVIGLAILLLLSFGDLRPAAGQTMSSELVRFEKIEKISITELWRLALPDVIFSDSDPVISFWRVDADYYLTDGDWRLIGVAVGGFSGLYESPVAAKVWVKGDIILLLEASRAISSKGDTATAVFGLPASACPQENPSIRKKSICEKLPVTFAVKPDREVHAGGVRIGTVRFE